MDIRSLNKNLNESIQTFIEESKLIASEEYSKRPVTEGELFAESRLVAYLGMISERRLLAT